MAISPQAELIAVYAANKVANIGTSPKYQQLLRTYGADPLFQAQRNHIETAKVFVEDYLDPVTSPAQQVREALDVLVGVRGEPEQERDLYYELIATAYKPKWSTAQQEHFEKAWQRVKAKYDFFLSFTQRFPDAPGDNPVNSLYRAFIIRVLGKNVFDNADRRRENLLALAVYTLLKQPSVEGFYFPDSQYDNTVVIDKLDAAASNSLVFLQLVQNMMFVRPESGENYCFNEFKRARELSATDPLGERRLLFAVAERHRDAFIEELRVPLAYRDWHRYVASRDVHFLEIEPPGPQRVEALLAVFVNNLAPLITGALHRIIDAVPE